MPNHQDVYVYRIDHNDIIVHVSENWEAFGRANAWIGGQSPDTVVGRSLWEFFDGAETRHLYRQVFRRVRAGTRCGPIPFRCDSPQERRFLTLRLEPLAEGGIELTSSIVRCESREPVVLPTNHRETGRGFIRICSMCKQLALPENRWVEVEEGLARLKPFEGDEMPALTHGICPKCYRITMAQLDALGACGRNGGAEMPARCATIDTDIGQQTGRGDDFIE